LRLADESSIQLALGSGAARGLAHIGALRQLEKNNISISAVSGCSIGAMIGGFYACGKLDEAENYFRKMKINNVIFNFDPAFSTSGLINGNRISGIIKDIVGDIHLSETKIPFFSVATELTTGESITLKDCKLWEAIRASISIPGLIKPFEIDGKLFIDGGLTNPLPIDVLKKNSKTKVLAINLNLPPTAYKRAWLKDKETKESSFFDKLPKLKEYLTEKGIELPKKKNGTPGLLYILNRSFHIFQYEIAWRTIELNKPDYLVTPDLPDILFYDFHKSQKAIEEGKRIIKELMEKQQIK